MRSVLWMSGVVVGVAAIIGASRLWAESKDKKPAPRTRIAFFNMTYVVKNYDKYKEFQVEIKEIVVPFQKRDAELRSQLEELRKQAKDPTILPTAGEDSDKKNEELEEKAKKIQREIEDNNEKVKLKVGKRSDEEMRVIYVDVNEATQSYATANDLDLVLHYNDAITAEDFISAKNIARKMNEGGLLPVYWNPSMDISQDLVALLNQKLRKK